jgi:hypothetical protein
MHELLCELPLCFIPCCLPARLIFLQALNSRKAEMPQRPAAAESTILQAGLGYPD